MITNRYNQKGNLKLAIINGLADCVPPLYERWLLPALRHRAAQRTKGIIETQINRTLAQQTLPLFESIQIETINRCNNTCSFCPVNKNMDSRPLQTMADELFINIVHQLQRLDYAGSICLYSNNEPLLDQRIVDFHRMVKAQLPKAFLYLLTNGSRLTIQLLEDLMPHVDRLVINHYGDELQLNDHMKGIVDYCSGRPVWQNKVVLHLRKRNEYLTTRAGQAGNRHAIKPLGISCIYPYYQFIVRPDGKVSQCCNDALGQVTLGDLAKESLTDVWLGQPYRRLREQLIKGRANLPLCSGCDALATDVTRRETIGNDWV